MFSVQTYVHEKLLSCPWDKNIFNDPLQSLPDMLLDYLEFCLRKFDKDGRNSVNILRLIMVNLIPEWL
jgi:hypothetical protein